MLQKFSLLTARIESHPTVNAVKRSFVLLMPILLIGAIALTIQNIPIPFFQYWLLNDGVAFNSILKFFSQATTGFLSGYLVLTLSYYYTSAYYSKDFSVIVLCMLIAFVCFIASFTCSHYPFKLSYFGSSGIFTALVVTILSLKIFFFLMHLMKKSFRIRMLTADVDYAHAILSLIPLCLCILFFTFFNRVIFHLVDEHNLNDFLLYLLTSFFYFLDFDFASAFFYTFLQNFLWFFGIHGGNILESVALQVFPSTADTALLTKSTLDTFTAMGGSGTSMCFLFALLFVARHKEHRYLAFFATISCIFNINEILIFCFPIVLNPTMFIPFICVPLLALCISYFAFIIELLPPIAHQVSWTTPIFFSGYLLTDSLIGSIIQLIILILGTLFYIPFLRLSEKLEEDKEDFVMHYMTACCKTTFETGKDFFFLEDNITKNLARSMINKLHYDCEMRTIPLHYQAQVDANTNIIGAEALLRWKYNGKNIFPPLAVQLAKEDNFFDLLSEAVVASACRDTLELKKKVFPDIKISVNIGVSDLASDKFINFIVQQIDKYQLAQNIALEITEETNFIVTDKVTDNIIKLKSSGILLAIDDFSMGQTSLKYLQTSNFSYVKIDGELIRHMSINPRLQTIVKSVTTLGEELDFKVIAEFVENKNLRNIAINLGCYALQGAYYSLALSKYEFIKYCLSFTKERALTSQAKIIE